jgi:hypothetical protein
MSRPFAAARYTGIDVSFLDGDSGWRAEAIGNRNGLLEVLVRPAFRAEGAFHPRLLCAILDRCN